MTQGMIAADRAVLVVGGADAEKFLENLVTNRIAGMAEGACVYTALLSPKGKYLFDFFVIRRNGEFLIDVKAERAQALAQRLAMYRLRADVTIGSTDLQVVQGLGEAPEGSVADPRSAALGWRAWVGDGRAFLDGIAGLEPDMWTAHRIAHGVPETGAELVADDAYILEMGFERLNGVDFRKGCYVGQEITARMKHKTELRKGLVRVQVEGQAPECGTAISVGGKEAGVLYSTFGGEGLAHLRFDRMENPMKAGDCVIRVIEKVG
ncbi:YgfZ/GcvT domain-containing protein [Amaricoccus macauensis]|uniref:CAF17-like 4Fe-4S cluster assembly/insertion protein YgfZ n=1 Tax=Amaricoccus macauensis TaxID=57001 RepID=UPI003C79CC90